MNRTIGVFCLAAVLATGDLARAQQPPSAGEEGGAPRAADRQAPPEPKSYDKVITKEAKSDPGVFTVHRVKEKVYYEIPAREFGKDFLWVTQVAKTTLGAGYGGQSAGQRVVRWERRDNRVLLRSVSFDVVADKAEPIARAVDAANFHPIAMAFNVEAINTAEADAVVIDVTRLFTTEVPELSIRSRLRARGFDTGRAFVERVNAFPDNINVEAIHTYTVPPETATPAGPTPAPVPGLQAPALRPGSYSVLMHFSMVRLPEQPMMPRLADKRVGYFSVEQFDYGRPEHRAEERVYITRWRLEKKDPAAAVSEPVKPITYYVDPATPPKWVPYVKSGIEAWQPAFEAAGFKKAIVAADAPKDDPEWSPEDARYSVVRWLPSTIENAMGPHVHDPRTGEILESDIQMYHNIQNLQRSWYFTQVGPLDPRAAKLPLPDDLMGTLIEYVVAHEVGHTLGFQHNMKSSSLYPVEKLRDPEWLKTMGHVATLMDYSRFNYVAQPEDKIDPRLLIPGIGPYDKFATMWGYKPIPGAKTPDAERKTLDEWAREQDKTPWLRFSTSNSRGSDPGELTEAVGDGDAVQATALGLKNLKRVAHMLIPATSVAGEPYDDLNELYGRMLGQWTLEMNHVTAIVGGLESQEKYVGQDGVRFTVVPKAKQAAAVAFLGQNAFATPTWALEPDLLRRIEPNGALDRVRTAQARVLGSLLSSARIARMSELASIDGVAAYAPTDMLNDVRRGIFSELDGASVKVDPYRRNLQRAYVDLASARVNGAQSSADDNRALFRGELRAVDAAAQAAASRAADAETRRHLLDLRAEVAKALDPGRVPAAGGPPAGPSRTFDGDEAWGLTPPDTCWPDYAIRPGR
jgi:hypothetical protein